jgi:integrase
MMRYCVEIGSLRSDPTQGIKPPKKPARPGEKGRHTWSEDEIEVYRRQHLLGTPARLALELLIGTAQRKSDVVRMGRQHLRQGGTTIYVEQQKTGWRGEIPIDADLAAALGHVPAGNLTFLVTSFAVPYTVAGFGNAFREWCNEAGLPKHCSSHGLRKAACRRLAEAGCTPHQIAAISGHLSLSEVERYTKAVEQVRLARAAKAKTRTQIVRDATVAYKNDTYTIDISN